MDLIDKELIENFKKGDTKAFSEIFKLYSDKIYNNVLKLGLNHDDALDIVQTTFYKLFKNHRQFKGESSLLTYIISISLNEVRKRYRNEKRYVDLENEEIFSDEEKINEEKRVRRLKEVVNKGLKKLPYKYREVIVLKDIDGLSIQEIKKMLRISESTVKTRLHRARKILKDLIKDEI
ncbi:MAG: RNA polymerase sigma factor [candidate division WOR-3 bacterium]